MTISFAAVMTCDGCAAKLTGLTERAVTHRAIREGWWIADDADTDDDICPACQDTAS